MARHPADDVIRGVFICCNINVAKRCDKPQQESQQISTNNLVEVYAVMGKGFPNYDCPKLPLLKTLENNCRRQFRKRFYTRKYPLNNLTNVKKYTTHNHSFPHILPLLQ